MDRPDLESAREVLGGQPFSRLLGARLTAFGDGVATLELDLDYDLRQQHGLAHGGVVSYLADNAITFAAGSVLGPAVLTAGMAVEYLAPARTGPLVAEAVVEHATTRQAACRVVVSTPHGTCAIAQGRVRVYDDRDRPASGAPATAEA